MDDPDASSPELGPREARLAEGAGGDALAGGAGWAELGILTGAGPVSATGATVEASADTLG